MEAYFGAFEAHMHCYDVTRANWCKHLAPILNADATVVYMALGSDDRKEYASLNKALFTHYSIKYQKHLQTEDEPVPMTTRRNVVCLWKMVQKPGDKVARRMREGGRCH